jgi:hypothetical protein
MNTFERIAHLQKIWRLVAPHLREPEAADVCRWLGNSDRIIESTLLRMAAKFTPDMVDLATFNPVRAYSYTTATARWMALCKGEQYAPASI